MKYKRSLAFIASDLSFAVVSALLMLRILAQALGKSGVKGQNAFHEMRSIQVFGKCGAHGAVKASLLPVEIGLRLRHATMPYYSLPMIST